MIFLFLVDHITEKPSMVVSFLKGSGRSMRTDRIKLKSSIHDFSTLKSFLFFLSFFLGARPLVSARRGALKPSSEHVASKKRANGQRRGSPRGPHPCLPPDAAHQKAHGRPSPHATSALPVHSAPSRLAEEPSSPRASMLPRKGARRIVAMPISVLRRLHSLLPCAGQESPPDESRFDA